MEANQRQHENSGGKEPLNIVKAAMCCIVGVLGLNNVVLADALFHGHSS